GRNLGKWGIRDMRVVLATWGSRGDVEPLAARRPDPIRLVPGVGRRPGRYDPSGEIPEDSSIFRKRPKTLAPPGSGAACDHLHLGILGDADG
ncbi:hypothetical protein ABZ554_17495, partial [Streptomyces sp. NPDC020125]|uniref:hypothetical protein n=1 Tax=Streptomyces sp. NPDC020125 TaxID=3154593 RepID=UPI0033C81E50